MFTGIITELGEITSVATNSWGLRMTVDAPSTARGLVPGGSVAVDGVCLTAIEVRKGGFVVQVVPETGRRTTFDSPRRGRRVNLERPLKASDEVGGHFVQGHVDARATVEGWKKTPRESLLIVKLPPTLKGLVVEKGSIAINGVSLTVAATTPGRFSVALIPHTLEQTNLGGLRAGRHVNLEADILGKYVRAMLRE